MEPPVRQRMIRGMVSSLSRRGYAATSLAEVLAVSDAPRGSIYHYFPGGKDELVAAAVDRTLGVALDTIEQMRGMDLPDVVARFAASWRRILEATECAGACAIMAVSVGADKPELQALAADAFARWEQRLAEILEATGADAEHASQQAGFLLSSYEGAVLLARARGLLAVFDSADEVIRRAVLSRS